jgi:hypothetical protein
MTDDAEQAKVDLFYTMLALHAYNRGRGSGIAGLAGKCKTGTEP